MDSELEKFRRQWKKEVTARSRTVNADRRIAAPPALSRKPQPLTSGSKPLEDDDEVTRGYDLDDIHDEYSGKIAIAQLSTSTQYGPDNEPQSALEYYEKAVERETEGSLGESLSHYRKAFRMDHRVDHEYKKKHFPGPPPATITARTNPLNVSPTVPNTAHHSLHGSAMSDVPALLASFANLSIEPAQLEIGGTSSTPCYLARLPPEILTEILLHAALADVTCVAQLARTCKRLAYLINTEDGIWRRLCLGDRIGLSAMHFTFSGAYESSRTLGVSQITSSHTGTISYSQLSQLSSSILLSPTYPSFRAMFRSRPRIRFSGVYISTVNYVRPGAASPTQISWNTPVHIVTYYRYLRFYRNGTCISLLTTTEPAEVVPHVHARNMPNEPRKVKLARMHDDSASGPTSPEAAALMKQALPGRWRLAWPTGLADLFAADHVDGNAIDGDDWVSAPEGDVHIETAGPAPEYTYSLHLALRSAAGTYGPRNTKLAWRSFWSYNKLTDDWAEFGLKNDRAFVWSRVRSWGDA